MGAAIQLFRRGAAALLVGVMVAGCAHFISDYDARTYSSLTDLKAKTLFYMDALVKAQPRDNVEDKLDELRLDLEKAYQYEKGKSENAETADQFAQLRTLLDDTTSVIEAQHGKLSADYWTDRREQFERAFDVAISTESAKIRGK